MKLRSFVASILVLVLLAPAAHAQATQNTWREYAAHLPIGTSIVVHTTKGIAIEGRLLRAEADDIVVLPKTRLPVSPRTLSLADIKSIDARTEQMSPGAKVLTGVGVAGGIVAILGAVAVAGMR
jgi:hypothetical protein